MSFYTFCQDNFVDIASGIPVTLSLWVASMTLGGLYALCLTWMRLYGNRLVKAFAITYVEVFRGTPMLVQLLFIYLGLPAAGIVLSPFSAALIAMALNTAAYQSEYLRGAITSIPGGQANAARAMGMSTFKCFRLILLPQGIRRMLPQWSNEAITNLKYTSVAFAIGLTEVTAKASEIGSQTYEYLYTFMVVALIFLAMSLVVAELLKFMERRLQTPGLAPAS
ncbi:ABC transporter permease subunit [Pseudomonas sp. NPDC008258]|uniref:amino acid ABC transporter permease n=1 Tax=Pseudomonas sp. NPDC008258 TaxID=3364418 RepID=UPI0036E267A6